MLKYKNIGQPYFGLPYLFSVIYNYVNRMFIMLMI